MKHHYGQHTGMPIHVGLPVGMTLCEELHLIGNGCEYDGVCERDETGICLRERDKEK